MWISQCDCDQIVQAVTENTKHKKSKKKKEKQEPFVISVSETIVHEHAMVVKFLHTSVAEVAVVSILWS